MDELIVSARILLAVEREEQNIQISHETNFDVFIHRQCRIHRDLVPIIAKDDVLALHVPHHCSLQTT